MTSSPSTPAPLSRGEKTRRRVLSLAVQIATAEGLTAITIGRMAGDLGMSKAGLFGHFGSKQALQLATLEAAGQAFSHAVLEPAARAPAGVPRLLRLLDGWIEHIRQAPGGCFFVSVATEFDARPGPVRDRVAEMVRAWLDRLRREIEAAVQLGQLRVDAPKALARELYGQGLVMNLRLQLLDEQSAPQTARAVVRERLRAAASPTERRLLAEDR